MHAVYITLKAHDGVPLPMVMGKCDTTVANSSMGNMSARSVLLQWY